MVEENGGEDLNALTVIRGYMSGTNTEQCGAVEIIERRVDDMEDTIQEVNRLAPNARQDTISKTTDGLLDHRRCRRRTATSGR